MLTFWIIAGGMILVAIAFVILPLLQQNSTDNDRNKPNIAIYKERMADLEYENLTTEQFVQAKQELQKALAQDLDTDTTASHQSRARWASIVAAIVVPIIAIGGYWHLGSWHLLAQAKETSSENMSNIVAKLAQRLENNPDDLKGWQMLARSYKAMGNFNKATQTYVKILARFKEDPEALFFLGMAAMETADYQTAIDYWQRLLKQIPSTDMEVRSILEKRIAEARQLAQ